MFDDIAAIVIGRNEGPRLEACLASLQGVARLIYVDSGSTDDSVAIARAAGAEVVALDLSVPFTAARARNAGLAALDQGVAPDFVQFVDGDCAVREGWLEAARGHLMANPRAAIVCGRRRERYPDAKIYNAMCDAEWDTPVGLAKACGGDALMRLAAVRAVGGYRDDLIAGEEPEMCVRLRQAGWEVWRIGAEMTWHDAAMTRFGQWWRRTKRAGHAFAEGAAIHGAPPERHWVAETRRALVWGFALPLVVILAVFLTPWALLGVLVYPLQIARLSRRLGWTTAGFTVLGKVPEAFGALGFYWGRVSRRRSKLIEYK